MMYSLSDESQKLSRSFIGNTARAAVLELGGDLKLDCKREYPPLISDENAAKITRKTLGKILDEQNIINVIELDMGAEDFALLTRERIGAYIFVGISRDLRDPTLYHSFAFYWEDENLKVLMQGDSMMALGFLNS